MKKTAKKKAKAIAPDRRRSLSDLNCAVKKMAALFRANGQEDAAKALERSRDRAAKTFEGIVSR